MFKNVGSRVNDSTLRQNPQVVLLFSAFRGTLKKKGTVQDPPRPQIVIQHLQRTHKDSVP